MVCVTLLNPTYILYICSHRYVRHRRRLAVVDLHLACRFEYTHAHTHTCIPTENSHNFTVLGYRLIPSRRSRASRQNTRTHTHTVMHMPMHTIHLTTSAACRLVASLMVCVCVCLCVLVSVRCCCCYSMLRPLLLRLSMYRHASFSGALSRPSLSRCSHPIGWAGRVADVFFYEKVIITYIFFTSAARTDRRRRRRRHRRSAFVVISMLHARAHMSI